MTIVKRALLIAWYIVRINLVIISLGMVAGIVLGGFQGPQPAGPDLQSTLQARDQASLFSVLLFLIFGSHIVLEAGLLVRRIQKARRSDRHVA